MSDGRDAPSEAEIRAVLDAARRREFYDGQAGSREQSETSVRRAYEMARTLLRSGDLSTLDSLSEDKLASILGSSRNAMRKALQQLAEDGLLIRKQRSGTHLARELVHIDGGRVVPTGMEGGHDGRLSITYYQTEPVILSSVVRKRLEATDNRGLLSETHFDADGEPLSLRIGYVAGDPDEILAAQQAFDLAHPPPFAEPYGLLYGYDYGSGQTTIEAIRCEPRTAEILGVQVGSPILLSEVLVRDTDGVARELSYTYYRGDRVAVSHTSGSEIQQDQAVEPATSPTFT